jgi:hypothetical protein
LGSDYGTCDDRDYSDFRFETNIRKKKGDEQYTRRVAMLDFMGIMNEEALPTDSRPEPDSPWRTLALVQRKRLGDMDKTPEPEIGECEVLSKVTELQQREVSDKEAISMEDDGTIVVPASARDKDNKVAWAKSLDGGKQFSAREYWWCEYKIPAEMLPERKAYTITMQISSVHEDERTPFQWIVKSVHHKEKPMTEYKVEFPYTMGLWGETEPVKIELGGGEEIMKVMRQNCLPITVKGFKLTPA